MSNVNFLSRHYNVMIYWHCNDVFCKTLWPNQPVNKYMYIYSADAVEAGENLSSSKDIRADTAKWLPRYFRHSCSLTHHWEDYCAWLSVSSPQQSADDAEFHRSVRLSTEWLDYCCVDPGISCTRKHNLVRVEPPPPRQGIARVTSLKVLDVTVTEKLSVIEYVAGGVARNLFWGYKNFGGRYKTSILMFNSRFDVISTP